MAAPGRTAKAKQPESLNGWQKIADFLGQPTSVAQRWARSGMPRHPRGSTRAGFARPTESLAGAGICWEPILIATETADLTSELKRGLSYVRRHAPAHKKKRAP
jgi:hypothetical protein